MPNQLTIRATVGGVTYVATSSYRGPALVGAELKSTMQGMREGLGLPQPARDPARSPAPAAGETATVKGGKSLERKQKDTKSRAERRKKATALRKAAGAAAPASVARPPPAVRATTTPASGVQAAGKAAAAPKPPPFAWSRVFTQPGKRQKATTTVTDAEQPRADSAVARSTEMTVDSSSGPAAGAGTTQQGGGRGGRKQPGPATRKNGAQEQLLKTQTLPNQTREREIYWSTLLARLRRRRRRMRIGSCGRRRRLPFNPSRGRAGVSSSPVLKRCGAGGFSSQRGNGQGDFKPDDTSCFQWVMRGMDSPAASLDGGMICRRY